MEKVLSLLEFQSKFPDEESCFQYLVKMRWPNGFKCPKCGHTEYYFIAGRKLFQCQKCRFQASVTAGTVFHNLKQPLSKLFWTVYLTATSKKGISAMELQRKLGIKAYNTAWLLMHKLREAMVSSGAFPLKILVEADETYVGGAKQGKAGRGAQGKNLVAAAVEVDPETEAMGRAYLQKIQTHSMKELSSFINSRVAKGTKVKTDGLPSYNFLEIEYDHITTKAKDVGNEGELLPKVHIVIANFNPNFASSFKRLIILVFDQRFAAPIVKRYV